jgi:hypothetical protein
MSGRGRGSIWRRVCWGVVAWLVTTLGTLLSTYLNKLHFGVLSGTALALAAGLGVAIILEFIDIAKDGGEKNEPPGAIGPPYSGMPSRGGFYPVPMQPERGPRRAGNAAGYVALVLVLIVGGFGVQFAGHKAIDFINEQTTPPWVKKTQDPGRERIAKPASHTSGGLTVKVPSVRVNGQATIVTISARNATRDSLTLPVFANALLEVPGVNTFNADPAAGTFSGTVPAGGNVTGTIVFDGVLGNGAMRVTLSFAQVYGSLGGPDHVAVVISIAAG